jgi:hypothetical protein
MPSKPIEDLLMQMGFHPEDFNSIRRARTREEATQKLRTLRERFKVAFRKKILELHPDRTNGDPKNTTQFRLLLEFAKELENTQVPQVVESPRVTVYKVTFHNPVQTTRNKNAWAGLPDEVRTRVTSNSPASTVAGMRPSGVVSTRGR